MNVANGFDLFAILCIFLLSCCTIYNIRERVVSDIRTSSRRRELVYLIQHGHECCKCFDLFAILCIFLLSCCTIYNIRERVVSDIRTSSGRRELVYLIQHGREYLYHSHDFVSDIKPPSRSLFLLCFLLNE